MTDKNQDPQLINATHGGVRIQLPTIDPAALQKTSADTTKPPVPTVIWFDLSITGSGMAEMHFTYSIGVKPGGNAFEIKGIPAGLARKFTGKIIDGNKNVAYEGAATADVIAGKYSDLEMTLSKSTGSVGVCVIIEGQPLPPCAILPPIDPPDTVPVRVPVPVPVGSMPLPGGNPKEQTLCFSMQFDYGGDCRAEGFAKMNFIPGVIKFGNLTVNTNTQRSYSSILGMYDATSFRLQAVSTADGSTPVDSLMLTGMMGAGATMAKGEYVRLPSMKKGIWSMAVITCGSIIWAPPNPKCKD
ncbi:MAG: hypothetical protein ABIW76_03630 [Fibrobacteria bacterium]